MSDLYVIIDKGLYSCRIVHLFEGRVDLYILNLIDGDKSPRVQSHSNFSCRESDLIKESRLDAINKFRDDLKKNRLNQR